MQLKLRRVGNCTIENGLEVNLGKTAHVLFTRRYKVSRLKAQTIVNVAKYLGLIMDKKLNWAQNAFERVQNYDKLSTPLLVQLNINMVLIIIRHCLRQTNICTYKKSASITL